MTVVQLDLFNMEEPVAANAAPEAPKVMATPVLDGMYYEKDTDKYVSFVRGKRHYEEPAKGCRHMKEWQERTKKERAI